jgi:hypothetical protein
MNKYIYSVVPEREVFKIGFSQLAAGCIGLLMLVIALAKSAAQGASFIMMVAMMLAFFGFTIYCGIACFHLKTNALKLSLVNQCLQLVSIFAFGYEYYYNTLFNIRLCLLFGDVFKWTLKVGFTNLNVSMNQVQGNVEIGVDLVAVVMIIWIVTLQGRMKPNTKIDEASEIFGA